MTTPDPRPPADEHSELPLDPDLSHQPPTRGRTSLPLHLSVRALGIVALGGTVGTAARYYLSELVRPSGSWPTATFVINVAGAFVLGVLLEELARRGPDLGGRRRLRLLGGTGFCGAFTTYSALAVDTDRLVRGNHPGLAVGYALGTVIIGLAASAFGIWLAARHVRHLEDPAVTSGQAPT